MGMKHFARAAGKLAKFQMGAQPGQETDLKPGHFKTEALFTYYKIHYLPYN